MIIHPKVLAFLTILLASMFWGSSFVFVQKTVEFDLWGMTSLRLFFASLLVGIIFLFRSKASRAFEPAKDDYQRWLILGVLMFISLLPQAFALQGTSVANSAVITALYVIMTPFWVWLLRSRTPSLQKWVATFIGFSAFFVLGLEQGFSALTFYDGLTFISAIAIAVHIVIFEEAVRKPGAFYHALLVPTLLCFLLVLSGTLWVGTSIELHRFSATDWLEIIYLGAVATALPYILMAYAQIYLNAVQIVLVTASEPIWALLFALALQGDRLTIGALIACGLLILANYVGESRVLLFSKNRT